jgi:hypothetical protein
MCIETVTTHSHKYIARIVISYRNRQVARVAHLDIFAALLKPEEAAFGSIRGACTYVGPVLAVDVDM